MLHQPSWIGCGGWITALLGAFSVLLFLFFSLTCRLQRKQLRTLSTVRHPLSRQNPLTTRLSSVRLVPLALGRHFRHVLYASESLRRVRARFPVILACSPSSSIPFLELPPSSLSNATIRPSRSCKGKNENFAPELSIRRVETCEENRVHSSRGKLVVNSCLPGQMVTTTLASTSSQSSHRPTMSCQNVRAACSIPSTSPARSSSFDPHGQVTTGETGRTTLLNTSLASSRSVASRRSRRGRW